MAGSASDHDIISNYSPPVYGDRPEPWQRDYSCICGADLGFDEEGGKYADVDANFENHLREEGLLVEDEEDDG